MKKDKKKLLNLGCGNRYHREWINIDFVSATKDIIAHDLRKGIPFAEHSIDVVYHSHVLEHFPKKEAENFIKECFRVLKPGGILRVAIPDLEVIVKEYVRHLNAAMQGDAMAKVNYEWIMLEMYDQVVREVSGGEMAKYIQAGGLKNEEYVVARLGAEAKKLRERSGENSGPHSTPPQNFLRKLKNTLKKLGRPVRLKEELRTILLSEEEKQWLAIGKFRSSGEIHQWMYDRHSLSELLRNAGFANVIVQSAQTSAIENWNSYELDSKQGLVHKPDSLFMEGLRLK